MTTTAQPPSATSFFAKLKRALPHIPFAEDALAAWYCARDTQTPAYVRGVLYGALAYFVLPSDVIPDVLIGLGYTDDASVLAAALATVSAHLRPEHREQARDRLQALAASAR